MDKKIAVELLQEAKRTLRMTDVGGGGLRHSEYICDNIRDTKWDNVTQHHRSVDERVVADVLIDLISERLSHQFSVRQWLINNGYVTRGDHSEETFRQIQLYRQRWLDDLIREFSA